MTTASKLETLLETQRLANKLMDEFGLIDQGWTFRISNTKNSLGRCFHNEQVIEISKHWLHVGIDEIEDTIRHEIAHAIAGHAAGHGHLWRRAAIECGARPTRCAENVQSNGNYNYTVTCLNCGWKHGKHRLRSAYMNYHCKHCGGSITVVDLKTGDIYKTKAVS